MRLAIALVCALVACGNPSKAGDPDGNVPEDMGSSALCGNAMLEDGEDCDDGNRFADLTCDENCHFTCGNGVFDDAVGEICEVTVTSGAGSCPTSCDDGDACTTDVLAGSECTAACESSPITAAADGDGCCPAGANANTDNDCSAMCGNGILETGELCDPAIALGAGACPATCSDQQSCTTDTLMSAGTCQAACVFTAITTNTAGDGCCRSGATPQQDSDCAGCGNGVVEPGLNETCDTAIASGTGSCPTVCTDANACTSNVLSNPGTCRAACAFPAITAPINNDGCCPPGANALNDNNCTPVCRNGVTEPPEQCDDNNAVNTDACSNNCTTNVVPTAFRFRTLALRDPHAFASVPIFGCSDITNSLLGNAINEQFTANITMDGDSDGFLDLSPMIIYRPLNQTASVMPPMEMQFANCAPPDNSASAACAHDPASTVIPLVATNATAAGTTCLGTLAGTVRPYNPAVTPAVSTASAACFSSNTTTVTFDLAGVAVTLTDARVAAVYTGNPATGMTNGLLRGFMSKTVADMTFLPADLAVVGGKSLGELLRGGTGNCQSGTDMDMNNGVAGWWFYLNFTTSVRPWTD